jgi:hypothetical protein
MLNYIEIKLNKIKKLIYFLATCLSQSYANWDEENIKLTDRINALNASFTVKYEE